jgi:hypothetical protein
MPVTIIRNGGRPPRESNRSQPFNAAVRRLAAHIAAVREERARSVEEIMTALNARGIPAPNGKAFTYGTTFRVLKRLKKLGLGEGPRSVSQANSARIFVPRRRPVRTRGHH